LKRYLKKIYNLNIPHYSISIIRGKGIDENALLHIINKHKNTNLQFVDGWIGKGAVFQELKKAVEIFNQKYKTKLNYELAVIADPTGLTSLSAVQEDIFIPSSCLNSTVSGLISRTVHNKNFIEPNDFHGVKIYNEFLEYDLSNFFINKISNCFKNTKSLKLSLKSDIIMKEHVNEQILKIQNKFDIKEWSKIKPGIGETTRVLLRRNALLILVKNFENKNIRHILYLADKKNIKIIEYKDMNYECIGIIS
ncbi:MAG: cysteine protease StiP family protein, partial [Fusobacteriales bacterium]|nr:cysteine protease StiP family protein [Fusobacteriales bacterium]